MRRRRRCGSHAFVIWMIVITFWQATADMETMMFLSTSSKSSKPQQQQQQTPQRRQLREVSASDTDNSCHLCADGSAAPWVDKAVTLPAPYGSAIQTCGALDAMAPLLLKNDSVECQFLQRVSTFCGCPLPFVEYNPCQLCHAQGEDETDIRANASKSWSLVEPEKPIEFDVIPSDILVPTCDIAQAYLNSLDATSEECTDYRASLSVDCRCQLVNDEEDKTEVQHADDEQEKDELSCSFCSNGDSMAFPDKDIAHMLVGIDIEGLEISPGTVITCRQVESFLDLLTRQNRQNKEFCHDARGLLAGICGCPSPAKSPCLFCGAEPLPEPDRMVYTFQDFGYPPSTCEDVSLFLYQIEQDDHLCVEARVFGFLCGCRGSEKINFRTQIRWIPKTSGIISILGSLYILWDVLIRKVFSSTRGTTVGTSSFSWRCWPNWLSRFSIFEQLIACVSFCDIIGSIGFLLSTIPMPVYNQYGEPTGTRGAHGTDATCTLQGSLIQFSFTGVLYQISLSTYYLLVICYGWSETRIRKYLWCLHIPFIIGSALTIAGIPLYQDVRWLCWIPPPPLADSYRHTFIFGFLPIGTAAIVATANMLTVYCKVRKQFATGNRWRMNNNTRHQSTPNPADLASSSSMTGLSATGKRRFFSRQSQSMDSGISSIDNNSGHVSMSADCRPRIRQTETPPTTRVSLDRELFWQCLLYLTVFYLSWTMLFLSQVEKYHNHHGLWVCISILSPLQGFNNFLVYIRPRVTKRFLEWRLKRWKQQRERRLEQELEQEQEKERQRFSPQEPEQAVAVPNTTGTGCNDGEN